MLKKILSIGALFNFAWAIPDLGMLQNSTCSSYSSDSSTITQDIYCLQVNQYESIYNTLSHHGLYPFQVSNSLSNNARLTLMGREAIANFGLKFFLNEITLSPYNTMNYALIYDYNLPDQANSSVNVSITNASTSGGAIISGIN